jgi:hypothetical protein
MLEVLPSLWLLYSSGNEKLVEELSKFMLPKTEATVEVEPAVRPLDHSVSPSLRLSPIGCKF